MEMPKPGPNHTKIAAFAGNWSGDETMFPSEWDPNGGKATASLISRIVCDGFFVAGDYEQKRDGKITYRGHSVFGIDPATQDVTLHWFDSMGMGVDVFRGKFQGQSVTLLCQNAMGHHRLTYDFSEKGTLRLKMDMSADGKTYKPMFEGAYHKRS